jgi:hypothetical protein
MGVPLMDADWSVELAADDPSLEFPWAAPDGSQSYVDLSRQPAAIADIPEALQYTELGDFLLEVNSPSAPWLTAKCDVWLDGDLGEAEDIYDAKVKFCCYVDLVPRDADTRFSFESFESWVKSAARALSSEEEDQIACEFMVRRCWYHPESPENPAAELTPGFYVTCYLFGYGDDQAKACARWADGLRRVTAVLIALAR